MFRPSQMNEFMDEYMEISIMENIITMVLYLEVVCMFDKFHLTFNFNSCIVNCTLYL